MVEWDRIWPGWSIGQHTVMNKMQLMQQLSLIILRPTKPNMETLGIIFIAYFLAFTPKTQNSPKITQKLPNILKNVKISQNLSKLAKLPNKCQSYQNYQKDCQKCWNGQNCQMSSKLSNVVNKLQNCQKFLSAFSKLARYFGKLILSNFFWVNFQN